MNDMKETRFDIYCPKCKYESLQESDDPCFACLTDNYNIDSHKPTYFAEKTQ